MGKGKKEKSPWLKVKKEAWLLAQELKNFEAEWRENLTGTYIRSYTRDSCLGNLRFLHSIRNH